MDVPARRLLPHPWPCPRGSPAGQGSPCPPCREGHRKPDPTASAQGPLGATPGAGIRAQPPAQPLQGAAAPDPSWALMGEEAAPSQDPSAKRGRLMGPRHLAGPADTVLYLKRMNARTAQALHVVRTVFCAANSAEHSATETAPRLCRSFAGPWPWGGPSAQGLTGGGGGQGGAGVPRRL